MRGSPYKIRVMVSLVPGQAIIPYPERWFPFPANPGQTYDGEKPLYPFCKRRDGPGEGDYWTSDDVQQTSVLGYVCDDFFPHGQTQPDGPRAHGQALRLGDAQARLVHPRRHAHPPALLGRRGRGRGRRGGGEHAARACGAVFGGEAAVEGRVSRVRSQGSEGRGAAVEDWGEREAAS